MAAPLHVRRQIEQASARRRWLRQLRMIELAGWHVAVFCGGVGLGVGVTVLLR